MIDIHQAIYALNSSIAVIRGNVAYDIEGNEVSYDKSAAEAKLAELEAEEATKAQAAIDAKESALAKLTALGLTEDEVKSLLA